MNLTKKKEVKLLPRFYISVIILMVNNFENNYFLTNAFENIYFLYLKIKQTLIHLFIIAVDRLINI